MKQPNSGKTPFVLLSFLERLALLVKFLTCFINFLPVNSTINKCRFTALSVKKQRVMREVSRTGWRARHWYREYFLLHGKSGESQSVRVGQHLSEGWPAECLPDEGNACC